MVILTIKAVWCPRHNHRSSVILGVYIISSPPPHFLVGAHLFEEAYVYIYLYREPFTTIISGLHHCPCLSQKLLPPTCDVASLSSILKWRFLVYNMFRHTFWIWEFQHPILLPLNRSQIGNVCKMVNSKTQTQNGWYEYIWILMWISLTQKAS